MRREYAEKPPIVSVVQLSSSQAEVMLRENFTTETRDNPASEAETGQITIYLADEYTVIVPWREGLSEAVEDNTEAWLEMAKRAEQAHLAAEARERRNKLLEEIDWTQTIDAPISAASREALRTYRQQLRDITVQEDFPYNIAWPERPAIEKGDPDPVDEAVDILLGGENDA